MCFKTRYSAYSVQVFCKYLYPYMRVQYVLVQYNMYRLIYCHIQDRYSCTLCVHNRYRVINNKQKYGVPPDHGQQPKHHTQKQHQEDEGDHTCTNRRHCVFVHLRIPVSNYENQFLISVCS